MDGRTSNETDPPVVVPTTNEEKSIVRMNDKLDIIKMDPIDEIVIKDAPLSADTTDKRSQFTARQQNSFAAKKTVAQGMMDVALITANANQLRYLIEYQRNSPTFYIILVLIIISLMLQIAVGVSLIFKGRFDMRGQSKSFNAQRINNYVVVGVFLITIINVFIASFSITGTTIPPPPPLPLLPPPTPPPSQGIPN